MIVFRVENDKGIGFYHDGFYGNFPPVQYWYPHLEKCSHKEQENYINLVHPKIPKTDETEVYENNSSWIFGFTSEQSMQNWFPEHILDKIPEFNGKILKYKIEEKFVKEFDGQCIFDVTMAIKLNSFNLK